MIPLVDLRSEPVRRSPYPSGCSIFRARSIMVAKSLNFGRLRSSISTFAWVTRKSLYLRKTLTPSLLYHRQFHLTPCQWASLHHLGAFLRRHGRQSPHTGPCICRVPSPLLRRNLCNDRPRPNARQTKSRRASMFALQTFRLSRALCRHQSRMTELKIEPRCLCSQQSTWSDTMCAHLQMPGLAL